MKTCKQQVFIVLTYEGHQGHQTCRINGLYGTKEGAETRATRLRKGKNPLGTTHHVIEKSVNGSEEIMRLGTSKNQTKIISTIRGNS